MLQDVYTAEDFRNWRTVTAAERPPIRLAVCGDPVAHSKSPPMHNAALRACNIPAAYTRLHIRPEELAETLRLLPANGFIGANITIPHKSAVLALVDEAGPAARRTGGINTVVVEGEKLIGFSTDGPGFARAIRAEFNLDLRDLRVLLLGAGGGAGRAIAVQCGLEGCQRLVLVNRTHARAEALAAELQPDFRQARVGGPMMRLEAVPWEEAALARQLPEIDLIVNATPLGMGSGEAEFRNATPLPSRLLRPHHLVYDTIYTSETTPMMAAAKAAGARGANGISMLLHQGALAFELWFGRAAPLEVMRRALPQPAAA